MVVDDLEGELSRSTLERLELGVVVWAMADLCEVLAPVFNPNAVS